MASGTRTDGQEEALRWNSDAGPLIEGLFAFMRKYTSARLRCHIWFDVDRQDTLDILHHCLREKPNAITFHRQAAEQIRREDDRSQRLDRDTWAELPRFRFDPPPTQWTGPVAHALTVLALWLAAGLALLSAIARRRGRAA